MILSEKDNNTGKPLQERMQIKVKGSASGDVGTFDVKHGDIIEFDWLPEFYEFTLMDGYNPGDAQYFDANALVDEYEFAIPLSDIKLTKRNNSNVCDFVFDLKIRVSAPDGRSLIMPFTDGVYAEVYNSRNNETYYEGVVRAPIGTLALDSTNANDIELRLTDLITDKVIYNSNVDSGLFDNPPEVIPDLEFELIN